MFARMMAFLIGAERIRWLDGQSSGAVFCSMLGHVHLYGLHDVEGIHALTVDLPQ
jgi:hypothetical protein